MKDVRKVIIFDLDTNLLKLYYPQKTWNNAYKDIKHHMIKNNFKWIQGSSYVSINPISSIKIDQIIDQMVQKYPWINICMRDCKEVEVGRMYEKNHLFNKDFNLNTKLCEKLSLKDAKNLIEQKRLDKKISTKKIFHKENLKDLNL